MIETTASTSAKKKSLVVERPILFTAPEVRAVLSGQKTQLRRAVPLPKGVELDGYAPNGDVRASTERQPTGTQLIKNRLGARGERLWVRETFAIETNRGTDSAEAYPPSFKDGRPVKWHQDTTDEESHWWEQCHYRATEPTHELLDVADGDDCIGGGRWNSSTQMPRWAARLLLEITALRVTRLHDIYADEIAAEGTPGMVAGRYQCSPCNGRGRNVTWPSGCPHCGGLGDNAHAHYEKFWDELYGKRFPWKSNPWVWVFTFRRVIS